jgi:hypothetical protein
MDVPLAKKFNGKKFMWDGVVYESDQQASQVLEDYAKEAFEVEKVADGGRFMVYNRRVATADKSVC